MMDKTQANTLRTWLFLLVIFLIILHYGSANDDQHGTENSRLAPGKSKAVVAMIPDQGPLRAERDVGQSNANGCYPDEYYSEYFRRCTGCTRCSRGTQHDPQEPCGHGRGQEAHCTPCDGGYYQSNEGIAVLTCQPCLTCDQRAVTKRTCSRQRNTVCGKCQKGWHYNETNACVECTERDMADPTNEDCYVKPDPTPGPNLTPLGPQSGGPGLDQDPSTRAPVSTVDGTSSGPLAKPDLGKALNPQTQNVLRDWHVGLICVAGIAALLVVLMAVFILYKQKNKKGKDVPPPAIDQHELQNLYEDVNEKPNHHRPGPSGPPLDAASNPMGGLMPPSSHQDSATESISHSSDCLQVDPPIDQDGPPTRNFVTTDTTHVPQPGPEDLSNDGPPSIFHSLKSFQPFQVPARHADVSQSPDEMVDPCAQMVDPYDQVTRYEDLSLQSGFKSLSSFLHHNTPGSPHRLI